MKYFYSFLAGAVLSLGAAIIWKQYQSPEPLPISTIIVRDSARTAKDTTAARTTAYITKIKWIPTDTLGLILRALAARPVVRGADTILPEPVDTTCRILLTCSEARQLTIRDTVRQEAQDSTNWDVKIQRARADSLEARLGSCLDKKPLGYVAVFEAGYIAGTIVTAGICTLVR